MQWATWEWSTSGTNNRLGGQPAGISVLTFASLTLSSTAQEMAPITQLGSKIGDGEGSEETW